ncbi:hypothetical protein K438DRAFT_1765265 [Mycena galopus ATCC 62051]|nr:hypothetical protein K438DRAFT_1765265 [Mycena galopus ATCC 62051]
MSDPSGTRDLNRNESRLRSFKNEVDDSYRDLLAASALGLEMQQKQLMSQQKQIAIQQKQSDLKLENVASMTFFKSIRRPSSCFILEPSHTCNRVTHAVDKPGIPEPALAEMTSQGTHAAYFSLWVSGRSPFFLTYIAGFPT